MVIRPALTFALAAAAAAAAGAQPIDALLVTGGHGFDEEPFLAMFEAMDDVEITHVVQPEANAIFETGDLGDYDVVVFYDMYQEITEEQKAALLEAIEGGLGIVALHHHLASWGAWPEWHEVLGGHYYTQETVVDGETRPASTFQHDVSVDVEVATGHPITEGVDDFTIHDEVYGSFWVSPEVEVLLTTDHPESTREIAWATQYGEGPIAYIQLGHGRQAYENESYRTLVSNAIAWAAGG
jgi:hypothetical protein